MDISSVTAAKLNTSSTGSLGDAERTGNAKSAQANDPEKTAEAARQFESILMRQFLTESMKGLLQGGPSGQVYGYLLTDSLADSITKGGGVGLTNVLQAQLKQ